MFNYYRFIGCEYSTVEARIASQALLDNYSIKVMHDYSIVESTSDQLSIIIVDNHIKDIFKN
jgi:ethanolamine ammonia-lyase large subunit